MLFITKLNVHGLLSLLLPPAFKTAGFHSAGRKKGADGLDDPALRMDMCWNEVAGKRFARFSTFVQDRWSQFVMMTIVIVHEPFRILTHVFMASSNKERSFVGYPALMDILYEPTSALVWALQYLSSLLRGTPSRTRLLWQPSHSSYVEWVRERPSEARFFIRSVKHAIGQIELRHVRKLMRLPWNLFTMADPRRPAIVREAMLARFQAKDECCVPFGFGRRIHKRRVDLTCFSSALMMYCVSWWVAMSLHCIERLHALNRRQADPRKAWHRFVADFVGAMLSGAREHRQVCLDQQGVVQQSMPALSDAPGPRAGRVVAQSAFQLYRKQWFKDQRELGFKCAVHEGAELRRQSWDNLSSAQRRHWEDQAAASAARAALWRKERALAKPIATLAPPHV